jgi:hypothetical protein
MLMVGGEQRNLSTLASPSIIVLETVVSLMDWRGLYESGLQPENLPSLISWGCIPSLRHPRFGMKMTFSHT